MKRNNKAKIILSFLLAMLMLLLAACRSEIVESVVETEAQTEQEVLPNDDGGSDGPVNGEAVVWSFSDENELAKSGVGISDSTSQGAYEFTAVQQEKAVSLKYSSNSSYAAYRMLVQKSGESALTENHTFVRLKFMTTQTVKGTVNIRNIDSGEKVTVVSNAASSKGAFVVSEPMELKSDFIKTWIDGKTWSIEYASMSSTSDFYLKEISFFVSKDDAFAHYGDSAGAFVDYRAITFGNSGNTQLITAGSYTVDNLNQCVNITHSNTEILSGLGRYAFGWSATDAGNIPNTYRYARILYQAENPTSEAVSMTVRTGAATSSDSVTWEGIGNTEDWTLSEWRLMNQSLFTRIKSGDSVYVSFNSDKTGGSYKVKAIYLFGSKADAEIFEVPKATAAITVEGYNIAGYSIVLPEDAVKRERDAAINLQGNILQISGVTVPIVTDTQAAEQALEILIGKTNRTESKTAYNKYLSSGADIGAYSLTTVNKKLVFAAFFNPGLETLISSFNETYLNGDGSSQITISNASLSGTLSGTTGSKGLVPYTKWKDVTNVANPVVFNDSFSGTEWWSEENNGSSWTMANGALSSVGNGYELTYLQVYEKNAVFSATITPSAAPSKDFGSFGLQLRYTSAYGYVRGGYDYRSGEWFIDYREGEDFTAVRAASSPATLIANASYTLSLTVENGKAILSVGGQKLLETSVTQVSPGRVALFDYDVACTVDNVKVEFSGGMGQLVIPDVSHTVLPVEAYLEGGSVIELSDGKLHYIHSSGTAFVSADNGKTFESEQSWYSSGYPSVIRLSNGNLMRTASEMYQGVDSIVVKISTNEGKTWTTVGKVCSRKYPGSTAWWAINMNDKLTQLSDGRIILVQNFEKFSGENSGIFSDRNTFFEIFYSDDNGATWQKSQTASYDLTNMSWFGEGKVIECADGTLRLMSSWNNNKTMVYSVSNDNGVTWGALQNMTGFDCSCSSYAIMRDPNGPTNYTYYMVWCYTDIGNASGSGAVTMPRSRLGLAYSTDGINWSYLGDIWCWESNYNYNYGMLNHIVDPFIYVTDDTVVIGSGISEKWQVIGEDGSKVHQAQRQHIWSIPKTSLTEKYSVWPKL